MDVGSQARRVDAREQELALHPRARPHGRAARCLLRALERELEVVRHRADAAVASAADVLLAASTAVLLLLLLLRLLRLLVVVVVVVVVAVQQIQ